MNNFLWALLLSVLPISELRGGILFAIGKGINPFFALFVLSFANMLVVPFVFLFLDYFHVHLMKINLYEKLFTKYLDRIRSKAEFRLEKFNYFKYFVLLSFVAIPLPTTGAYTATLIAWFFKIPRKKSFLAISLGVLIAGIIITLTSISIFSFF